MQCFHPISVRECVKDSQGRAKRTNNFRLVPCGKCVACLQQRRAQWTYRLTKESERCDLSYFVTLTYDDEHLLKNMFQYRNVVFPCFSKRDTQLYIKRLRKRLSMYDPNIKLSYLLVSEYGTQTFRPHYHAIMLFNGCTVNQDEIIKELICDCWQNSENLPVIEPCCQANIHYVTKYSLKDVSGVFSDINYFVTGGKTIGFSKKANTYLEKPFMCCSTRPYLGYSIESELDTHILANGADCTGVYLQGVPMPMPRIFRNKSGIVGSIVEASPDPRLNIDAYNGYKYMYDRLKPKETFDTWLNNKLIEKEQRSLEIVARKSEKV